MPSTKTLATSPVALTIAVDACVVFLKIHFIFKHIL